MTIAPIRKSVTVKAPPDRAFEMFVGGIGEWWPKGRTVGKSPHVAIVIEPWAGGRWFERAEDGVENEWGRVLDWSPPGRLLLAWQLDAAFRPDPSFSTDVELTFEAAGDGTRVTLEHRDLERFGDSARKVAEQLGGGWPTMLGFYAAHADTAIIPANTHTPAKETQA